MNAIDDWLGDMSKRDFVAEYFHKLPYSVSGGAAGYGDLCDWPAVERLLGANDVDVMVCRRGERYTGASPQTPEEARRLRDEGYTVLIRHAERHDKRLGDLAGSFARDFGGSVNVHVYATPPDQFGFGWHYDAEDVFIVQTAGSKEYSLRKNTVHPWPLLETLPVDMQFEREIMPLMRCALTAGDWLYIPAGYWHMAVAKQPAISVAVGVLSPAAIDIYAIARKRLAQSLVWRQRLPTPGDASPLNLEQRRERLREILAMLARDLHGLFSSEEFLDTVLDEVR